MENIKTVVL